MNLKVYNFPSILIDYSNFHPMWTVRSKLSVDWTNVRKRRAGKKDLDFSHKTALTSSMV